MRSKVLIAIFSFLGAVLGIALGLLLWSRSEYFDRTLARWLTARLEPLRVRLVFEDARLSLRPFVVELRDLRLFSVRHPDPLLRISRMRVRLAVEDLLSRTFSVAELQLERPEMLITFDPNGRPNLADIDFSALRRPAEPKPYTLRLGRVVISQGRLRVNDRKHHFDLRAEELFLSLAPSSSASRMTGTIRRLDFLLEEGTIARAHLEWSAEIAGDRVRLERARAVSDAGDVLVSGTIRGWVHPQYDFFLNALVHLDRVAANWPSPLLLSGDLTLRGRLRGQGRAYQLDVTAAARRATVWGIRVKEGTGEMRAFTASSAEGASSEHPALRLRASAVIASFFRAQDVTVGGTFPDAASSLFSGALRISSAGVGPFPVEEIHARLRLDPEQVFIEDLDARVLGGRVRGDARIQLAASDKRSRASPLSQAHLRFEGVSVYDLVARLSPRPLPFEGAAQGRLTAQWPGWAVTRAAGKIAIDVSPPSDLTGGSLPVRGALEAALSSRGLTVNAPALSVGRSQAAISGTVSWKGDLDLTLSVRAEDLAEHERLLQAYGYSLKRVTYDLVPHLSGTAEYRLHLLKRQDAYAISGEGEAKGCVLAGERVRVLRARFVRTPEEWAIEDTRILWESGARVEIARMAGSDRERGFSWRGRLHQVNVERWLKALAVDLPFSGTISGELALSGLPAAPSGVARLTLEDGMVRLLERSARFRRFSGSFRLDPPHYEIERAQLDLGAGTIRLSGSFRRDDSRYALQMRAEDLDLAPLVRGVFRRELGLGGRLSLTLSGRGTLAEPHFSGQAHVRALSIAGRPAGEISAEVRAESGRLLIPITATLFGQTHALLGSLDLTDPAPAFQVRARFQEFSLTPYFRLSRRLAEWGGAMSGELALWWPLGSLAAFENPSGAQATEARATLALSSLALSLGDYSLHTSHPFAIHLLGRRLKIEPVALTGENTSLEISGTVDLSELFGERVSNGHELEANGSVDLRLLHGVYPGLFTAGRATVRASLRGSFREPRLSGLMEITDLSLRVLDWPIALAHGQGRLRFTASQVLIETLRAQVNEGEMSLSGGLLLRNLRAEQWRILIRSEAVVLTYPRGLRSVVDGTLTLQGNRQLQILSGTITVRRSEYTRDIDLAQLLLSQAGDRLRPSFLDVPIRPPLSLDIRVQALDTLSVRNNLAEAIASASLHVGGTLEEPRLSGSLVVTRGLIRFRNREYQITRGRVDFPRDGATPAEPRFQLEAESDIAGYRVIVGLFGTLERFQTTLRSEPALPPEQVLSLIATGELSRGASATASQAGWGAAANLLIGELTHRAEEFTGKIFGINRFQIDPLIVGRGSDPTARLTIGRQISRHLSILYATNLSGPQEQVIIVEYRLSDRFSLVGTRDQDGNFSFDLRIRKRF